MYLFGPSFRYGFELIPRQHSVRRAPNFQPDSFRPDFGPRTRKNSCSRRKSEAWPGFHARTLFRHARRRLLPLERSTSAATDNTAFTSDRSGRLIIRFPHGEAAVSIAKYRSVNIWLRCWKLCNRGGWPTPRKSPAHFQSATVLEFIRSPEYFRTLPPLIRRFGGAKPVRARGGARRPIEMLVASGVLRKISIGAENLGKKYHSGPLRHFEVFERHKCQYMDAGEEDSNARFPYRRN